MNYDIRDTDLTRSLPLPLREDKTEFAIAKAVAEQLAITANLTEKAVLYARIDELDENILDTLAVDMHVDWYYPDADIIAKRRLIKDSVKVHKKLGTPWAVERVIWAYYDNGVISEWFEYGGEPGYFRIRINGDVPSWSEISRFLGQLEKVKRKTAWLEGITFTLEMPVGDYIGLSICALERSTIDLNANANALSATDFIGISLNGLARDVLILNANTEALASVDYTAASIKSLERLTFGIDASVAALSAADFTRVSIMMSERLTFDINANVAAISAADFTRASITAVERLTLFLDASVPPLTITRAVTAQIATRESLTLETKLPFPTAFNRVGLSINTFQTEVI